MSFLDIGLIFLLEKNIINTNKVQMNLQIKPPFYIDRRLRPTVDFSTLRCLNSTRNQQVPNFKKQSIMSNYQCYSLRHSHNNSLANAIRQQKHNIKNLKEQWYQDLAKKKNAIIQKNKQNKENIERVLQQLLKDKNRVYQLMKHKCDKINPCTQCKFKNMLKQHYKQQQRRRNNHYKTKSDCKLQANKFLPEKNNKNTIYSSNFNLSSKPLQNIFQQNADTKAIKNVKRMIEKQIKQQSSEQQILSHSKYKHYSELPTLLHKSLKKNSSSTQSINLSKNKKKFINNQKYGEIFISGRDSDQNLDKIRQSKANHINKSKLKSVINNKNSRMGSKLIKQLLKASQIRRKDKNGKEKIKLKQSVNKDSQQVQSHIDISDLDLQPQCNMKNESDLHENPKDGLKYNALTNFWDMEGTVNHLRASLKPKQYNKSIINRAASKQNQNSTFIDTSTVSYLKKSFVKKEEKSNTFRISQQPKIRMSNINKRFRKGQFIDSSDLKYKTLISNISKQSLRHSKISQNSGSSDDISFDEQIQQVQQQQAKKKRKIGKYRSGYIFSKYEQEKIVYKIMKKQCKAKDSSNKQVRKVRMSVPTIAFYQAESLDQIQKIQEQDANKQKDAQDLESMKHGISELNATLNSKKHLRAKISDEQAFKIFLKKISLQPQKLKIFKQELRQYLEYHSTNRSLFQENFRFFKYLQRNLQQSNRKQRVINDKMVKHSEKQLLQIQKVMNILQNQIDVPNYHKIQYSSFFLNEGMQGGYTLQNFKSVKKRNSLLTSQATNRWNENQQLDQISLRQIQQDEKQ